MIISPVLNTFFFTVGCFIPSNGFLYCMFVLQVPGTQANLSDSSAFLATISQPDSLSTLVSEISVTQPRNSTRATIATLLDVTNNSRSSSNQTALFEKNTRSQQDQCWETYVGQVLPSICCTLCFHYFLVFLGVGQRNNVGKITLIGNSVRRQTLLALWFHAEKAIFTLRMF